LVYQQQTHDQSAERLNHYSIGLDCACY